MPLHVTISFFTGRDGKYMYIEASSPRRQGHEAMLLVKLDGRAFCMRFWYHMYGVDTGSLTVMRIVDDTTDDHKPTRKEFKKEHIEWQKSKINENRWQQAEIELKVRKGTIHWVGSLLRRYWCTVAAYPEDSIN